MKNSNSKGKKYKRGQKRKSTLHKKQQKSRKPILKTFRRVTKKSRNKPNKIVPQDHLLEETRLREAEFYDRGHTVGFQEGYYTGGEGIVDQLLPEAVILPEVPLDQIVLAGLEHWKGSYQHVMGSAEVAEKLISAMDENKPISVVRLGDGELLTMSQGVLKSDEEIIQAGSFLKYAGIHIPDLHARDQLIEAVRSATIIGIPLLRMLNFQPLAFSVFKSYGIDYKQFMLTHSTINYALYLEHYLSKLLTGRRVLLIGNKAPELANILLQHGVHVAGTLSPVQGMKDIPRVIGEASAIEFDLALVSAGVPAVIIVSKIASELGKAAIDFGHLADSMISGEAPYA